MTPAARAAAALALAIRIRADREQAGEHSSLTPTSVAPEVTANGRCSTPEVRTSRSSVAPLRPTVPNGVLRPGRGSRDALITAACLGDRLPGAEQ